MTTTQRLQEAAHALAARHATCFYGADGKLGANHSKLCRAILEALQSERSAGEASARDEMHARFLLWRGIETPCRVCGGSGQRAYAGTSTWRGGACGQQITADVCDHCWGSGDEDRHGANLRTLEALTKA